MNIEVYSAVEGGKGQITGSTFVNCNWVHLELKMQVKTANQTTSSSVLPNQFSTIVLTHTKNRINTNCIAKIVTINGIQICKTIKYIIK